MQALERLANARAKLAGLERQAAPVIDPEIRAAVIERQQQIDALKADMGRRGRAGRQARQQVEALEGTQHMVMECLGYRSYEEFSTALERFDASQIDRSILDAARLEVDRAERHFFDTAEMRIPVPSAPAPAPAPAPAAAPTYRPPAPTPLTRAPRQTAAPRQPRPIAPPRWAAG